METLQEQLAQWNMERAVVYAATLPLDATACFDREQAQQAKRKKKDRQWFTRPPVEQNPFGLTTLDELEPIDFTEMVTKVNHVWTGRILFVTTIRSPFLQATALLTLVQQQQDDATMALSLWNYLSLRGNDDYGGTHLESELPNGSYLALAHPLVVPTTMNSTDSSKNDAPLMLRCDNPDTIRIFSSKEEWYQAKESMSIEPIKSITPGTTHSPAQLKEQGNAAFGKKDYATALRCYQRALDIVTTTTQSQQSNTYQKEIAISCLGNMAEVCLQTEYFEAAERHSRRILTDYDDQHFKAQFRLARALIPQNKAEQAKDIIMNLRKEHASHAASLQSVLGECLQAIMESRGKFNIKAMLGETSLSPTLPFHADYTSPQIELGVAVVRPSDGETYRGVLAKEDIAEGTLLVVSRAFAFCYQQGGTAATALAAKKKHMYEVSQVHQAVKMLQKNPRLAASFFQLEAGGQVPEKANGNTGSGLDLSKIRSILESNRFGVDLNSPASPFELKLPNSNDDDDQYTGVGLWLSVSMFNHSCTPNCTWAQIGNHMFVYACKDVSKGQELCISYVHPALSYQDRKERFQKWSGGKGFECGCEWCHWMRTSPTEFQAMNEEVKRAQMRMGSGEAIESIDQLLSSSRRQQIRDAHDNVPLRFQHTVYNLCMMEALHCVNTGNRRGALEAVKAATDLGYAIRGGLRQETRVQDLCCLAAAYMTCDDDAKAYETLETLCRHQLILPSLADFQSFVMLKSMQIWNRYQDEPFMKRWAALNKTVWEQRSKQLK